MRHRNVILLCGLALLGAPLVVVAAEASPPTQIPRQQHAWGRFAKGSWKKVRLTTEMVDEQGHRSGLNKSESRTVLDQADDDGVMLRVETTVDVEGKRFPSPPQTIRQGYNGQTIGQPVQIQMLQPETVSVEDRKFSCLVWQVQVGTPEVRRTSRVFYSAAIAPYILRRESNWTEAAKPGATHETITEVIALDMPFRVLDEVHTTAFERTTYRNSQSITTTVSVTSPDVPGGVVSSTSKEVDLQGRLLRRSTLELLEYGVEGEDSHPQQVRQRVLRGGRGGRRGK